jgi:hypothetical protein
MLWALNTSIRRSYSRLLASRDFQLEAAGTEGAGGGGAQGGDGRVAFLAGVDEVLGQGADDAVAAGVDLADHVGMLARGFDDAAGGSVDDGGDAAGLGVERILFLGHVLSLLDTARGGPRAFT